MLRVIKLEILIYGRGIDEVRNVMQVDEDITLANNSLIVLYLLNT